MNPRPPEPQSGALTPELHPPRKGPILCLKWQVRCWDPSALEICLPFAGFVVVLKCSDDGRISECRCVSKNSALGDVSKEAAHDFSRPSLGQIGADEEIVWPCDGANFVTDVGFELFDEVVATLESASEDDERSDRLAFDVVGSTDDGRFSDGWVIDQRGFNLHSRDIVTGDEHDVIYSPEKPEVTIGVQFDSVSSEVAVGEFLPIRLLKPVGIVKDSSGHAGPRVSKDEEAALRSSGRCWTRNSNTVAVLVKDADSDSWKWVGRGAGLCGGDSR